MRAWRAFGATAVLAVVTHAGGCLASHDLVSSTDAGSPPHHVPAHQGDATDVTVADVADSADVNDDAADVNDDAADAAEADATLDWAEEVEPIADAADDGSCGADAHSTDAGCLTCTDAAMLEAQSTYAWLADKTACTSDAECTLTTIVNHCWHHCLLAVRQDQLAGLYALLDELDLAYCGACQKDNHLCMTSKIPKPKCTAGKCSWQ